MKRYFVLLVVTFFLFSFQNQNQLFMQKLLKAYVDQMKIDVGKTFAAKQVKKNYGTFIYNYPELDDFKSETCIEFAPVRKEHAAFAVKIAVFEKENAKEAFKTLKKNLDKMKADKKTIKNPLLFARNGKMVYVISYACALEKKEAEKQLMTLLKEEAQDDWIFFNCGGSWELK